MTREDIMRMAKDVWSAGDMYIGPDERSLERFAALVAAHEREQCAKIVEHYTGAWSDQGYALTQKIRTRKEK